MYYNVVGTPTSICFLSSPVSLGTLCVSLGTATDNSLTGELNDTYTELGIGSTIATAMVATTRILNQWFSLSSYLGGNGPV